MNMKRGVCEKASRGVPFFLFLINLPGFKNVYFKHIRNESQYQFSELGAFTGPQRSGPALRGEPETCKCIHTMEGTLNAEQPPTAQTRSRNAFSFFQPAAGADFLAFLGINDA